MNLKTLYTYLETLIFTIGTIAFCYSIRPDDPLLVHSSFPWVWFMPALLALRHGRVPGLLAVAIVIATMLYTMNSMLFSWDSYQLWLLGGVTLTLICGEYNAMWRRRQFSLAKKSDYLDARIESLSRAYGVLRLSHDRLEESLIVKPATLREAVAKMRALLNKLHGRLEKSAMDQYMEILVYYASLDKAALYLKNDNTYDLSPISFIGKDEQLNMKDPLVERCLDHRQASYLSINLLEHNETSQYLAVVPMKTAEGEILALLTISDMAFITLNEETLKIVMLLLAYVADEAGAAKAAATLQQKYPDCPAMFAGESYKLKHLVDISGVDSTIFAYHLADDKVRPDIISLLIQQKRGLDIIWELKQQDRTVFMILMPLTERNMLPGYIDRMKGIFEERIGVTLGKPPAAFKHRQLSSYENLNSIIEDLIVHDYTV